MNPVSAISFVSPTLYLLRFPDLTFAAIVSHESSAKDFGSGILVSTNTSSPFSFLVIVLSLNFNNISVICPVVIVIVPSFGTSPFTSTSN